MEKNKKEFEAIVYPASKRLKRTLCDLHFKVANAVFLQLFGVHVTHVKRRLYKRTC